MSRVDNVRSNPDGTERKVEWVLEQTENDNVITYIAWPQGKKPRPHSQTHLHDRKHALGYIIHRKRECRLVLVNLNTSLSRRCWTLGKSTKSGKEHQIGKHGNFPFLMATEQLDR
jgi:hypothetical protein